MLNKILLMLVAMAVSCLLSMLLGWIFLRLWTNYGRPAVKRFRAWRIKQAALRLARENVAKGLTADGRRLGKRKC